MNQAIDAKPKDMPLSERARALQARVKAQSTPVDVTLKSDGETHVSITHLFLPQQLYTARMKLMPGDYEVRGQRRDRTDVLIKLRVRNGEAPPGLVTVVCK
jgi:hypothetical protein